MTVGASSAHQANMRIAVGLANVWARGDSIFNLFAEPQLIPGDRGFIHLIEDWRALAANAEPIVAGLHAAAALFHHDILHDPTLRRMLPWKTR